MNRSGTPWSNAPFVRLVIPLCLGVGFQHSFTFPLPLRLVWLLLFLWMGLWLARKCSFSRQPFWGAVLLAVLFCFGYCRAQMQTRTFPLLDKQRYLVALDSYPVGKANTYQVVGRFVDREEKIVAYLAKTPQVRLAQPGDLFCFEAKPELIRNEGNPFEFDYRRYLNDRGIGYRLFLKEGQFFFLAGCRQPDISRNALIIRKKLVEILDRSGMNADNAHLVASIAFGARDEVDKEVIASFTNTGVIHVLAVSGMNVGLIYVILDFLLRFLKARRAGRLLHALMVLVAIWGYALVTGMSASILRAAMMFTFVVIGASQQRNANIFNSLAVSAFLLIAWEPAILWDVGFQLSYAAVLSIVVIQPVIYQWLYFKSWLPNQIWLLLSVTFAAQVGTLPFILHYFHQFPVYFWLANLVVVPLVTLILYLSFVVIALSFLSGSLTSLLAHLLDWSVWLVLATVGLVGRFPCAVIGGLYPSLGQVLLVFLAGYLLYLYLKNRRDWLLTGVVLSALVVAISAGFVSYRKLTRKEVVFFNIPGTRALALTSGRTATVLYDPGGKADAQIDYYLKPYLGARGIRQVERLALTDSLRLNGRNSAIVGNLINFHGLRLYVQPSGDNGNCPVAPSICPDLVWLADNRKGPPRISGLPESAILLCRSPNEAEDFATGRTSGRQVKVDKAVLLRVGPPRQVKAGRLDCGYFDWEN